MATYETASDRFITVGDIRFAYRWLGRRDGIPLVLLMHFRFAAQQPVMTKLHIDHVCAEEPWITGTLP